ncbi:MAG: NAD(P)/FAD-dependent oxidoreductase [Bacteroidales bacterium]|jgi:predicted Rossmann fold flavoprotein|nr:NAD(P)/FAD-dependent oxidoreductase [Bacteroidales bacterium]
MTKYDIIIVGGGASGLMCAVSAVKCGKRVLLLEKMPQCGLKLRISGKGRCNMSNVSDINNYLRHIGSEPRFLYPSFKNFFTKDLIDFMAQMGVETKVERGNRLYPQSDKAQDVFFALIHFIETSEHCDIIKDCAVKTLLCENERVIGVRSDEGAFYADKVVLATGGLSYPQTGSTGDGYKILRDLGFEIVEPVPALMGLKCDKVDVKWLFDAWKRHFSTPFTAKNVKVTALDENEKKIAECEGEVEFRDYGVSGAAILTLSRMIARKIATNAPLVISIDLKPSVERAKLDAETAQYLNKKPDKRYQMQTLNFGNAVRHFLPEVLTDAFFDLTKLQPGKRAAIVTSAERKQAIDFMKVMKLRIIGSEGWSRAVITQGGVALNQINPKTLESKRLKGLYFCGEILDLDGDTGGYNLQIAFSTGYLAGKEIGS